MFSVRPIDSPVLRPRDGLLIRVTVDEENSGRPTDSGSRTICVKKERATFV
jgi:hypothetical protein